MDDSRRGHLAGLDDTLKERIVRFSVLHRLTAAEEDVLGHLLLGHDISMIIEHSGRSRATVKTHVLNIFSKTSTHRQAELVSFFFRVESETNRPS